MRGCAPPCSKMMVALSRVYNAISFWWLVKSMYPLLSDKQLLFLSEYCESQQNQSRRPAGVSVKDARWKACIAQSRKSNLPYQKRQFGLRPRVLDLPLKIIQLPHSHAFQVVRNSSKIQPYLRHTVAIIRKRKLATHGHECLFPQSAFSSPLTIYSPGRYYAPGTAPSTLSSTH